MLSSCPVEANLNCVSLGAGEDLVLIHGLGANLSFWFFGGAQLLAKRRRVIMYDLRGHGRSPMPRTGYSLAAMAADLYELLDRVGAAKVDIVGHSFGGRVALAFASAYAERVRNLIIADTQLGALQAPMRLRDWAHWPRWRAQLQASGLDKPPSDDAVIDYKLLVELSQCGDVANGHGSVRRRGPLRPRQIGGRTAVQWQRLLQQTTAAAEFEDERPLDKAGLAAINAPTLLMFGEFSHCLPTANGLLELLPDARFILVPGAGHFFPIVKPVYFERGLNSFLGQAAADSGLQPIRRSRLAARARRRALT